jgi:hypothetical protein
VARLGSILDFTGSIAWIDVIILIDDGTESSAGLIDAWGIESSML